MPGSALRGPGTRGLPHVRDDSRIGGDRLLSCFPVGREVVLAAQPVVIDASGVCIYNVELQLLRLARELFGHTAMLARSKSRPAAR